MPFNTVISHEKPIAVADAVISYEKPIAVAAAGWERQCKPKNSRRREWHSRLQRLA